MFGLYRRAYGGEIVRSFYDFDTKTIGPYTIPQDFFYDVVLSQGDFIPEYIYYKVILESRDVLAVFNLNNHCLVCITKTSIYQLDKQGRYDSNLYEFALPPTFRYPILRHMGYWKTYQENFAVSTLPYFMFVDVNDCIDGTGIKASTPTFNPPFSLYKLLVDTPDDIVGIYYNIEKSCVVYIKRLEDGTFVEEC